MLLRVEQAVAKLYIVTSAMCTLRYYCGNLYKHVCSVLHLIHWQCTHG